MQSKLHSGGFALLPLLLVVVVIGGGVLAFSFHAAIRDDQAQWDRLKQQVLDKSKTNLPSGAISMEELAPDVQQILTAELPPTGSGASPEDSVVIKEVTQTIIQPANVSNTIIQQSGGASLNGANVWTATQTFISGFTLNGTTITDIAGPGLQVVGGVLQTTLGNSISASEIGDGAVTLAKLDQSCNDGDMLQYNGASWACAVAPSGITSLNGLTGSAQLFVLSSVGSDITLISSGNTHTLTIPTASVSARGVLSATDWNTFNTKQDALTFGNLTTTTSGFSITGGTGAVIGSGVTIDIATAGAGSAGLLSATDWNTFNDKQDVLVFGAGLTKTGSTITSNATSGVAGGQTITGGTANGENLTLTSTASATKGKIFFGSSNYDEAANTLNLTTTSSSGLLLNVTSSATSTSGLAALDWSPSSAASSSGDLLHINAGSNATIGSLLNITNNGTVVFKVGQTSVTFGAPATFADNVTFQKGFAVAVVHHTSTSGSYTVGASGEDVVVRDEGSLSTVSLPDPAQNTGRRITFINQASNNTVFNASGVLPPESSTVGPGQTLEIISDGVRWNVISLVP